MTNHLHEVCLESDRHFEGRIPTHHLGILLAELPVAIRGAVSMAIRSRSKAPGRQPNWLRRASDLRFIGHGGNGVTELQFELPTLGDAASEIYEQRELFESGRPAGCQTGLDLLMKVFSDIDAAPVTVTRSITSFFARSRNSSGSSSPVPSRASGLPAAHLMHVSVMEYMSLGQQSKAHFDCLAARRRLNESAWLETLMDWRRVHSDSLCCSIRVSGSPASIRKSFPTGFRSSGEHRFWCWEPACFAHRATCSVSKQSPSRTAPAHHLFSRHRPSPVAIGWTQVVCEDRRERTAAWRPSWDAGRAMNLRRRSKRRWSRFHDAAAE